MKRLVTCRQKRGRMLVSQLTSPWPSVIPPGPSVHGSIPSIFRVGLPSVKHLWKPEVHSLGDSASSHVDNEE